MRILVTGSAQGLGRDTAVALLDDGHDVIVHVRTPQRRAAAKDLTSRGAEITTGDLGNLDLVRDLAQQVGPVDTIIHNAGVISGNDLLTVNVLAPYLLTALVPAGRHIYLSSSMHRGGRPDPYFIDLSGAHRSASYSDSKLLVTTLAAAVTRQRPGTISHAVDPGWVPTRMGGPSAPDDLHLGHRTQQWLATTDDPDTAAFGYWHHQRRQQPHPATLDLAFQDQLLQRLEHTTGTPLTPTAST